MFKNIFRINNILKKNLSRWSALEKTFNSKPNSNLNLTTKDVGLFCVPQLNCIQGFYYLTEKCIEKSENLILEALSINRTKTMVNIFDELSDTLCQVADLAEFIRFSHPSTSYSKAAEDASVAISGVVEKLNTNIDLYNVLKKTIDNNNDNNNKLNDLDKFVCKLFLFDFEQSGIHLNEHQREIIVELNNNILTLGQLFVNGVAKPTIVNKDILPENIRDVFSSEGDNIVVSGLYADSPNPIVREMAYRLFLHPDENQEKILTKLLEARFYLAKACNFENYAHRALRGGILEEPKNVTELLDTLRDKIKEKAENDFNDMRKMISPTTTLQIWDVPYFTQKAKKERFNVTAKEYSPYFSLGACMEGLNIIFQSLYDISLENSEILPGEIWSKDVYKLGVKHKCEGLLGYIYCDFYERNFKPNQDCHFTIRGGRELENGTYQLPIVVLMLNFSLPRWSNPTLLTPNMVDNLFHEMGHAIHSMLARTKYQHISGTRCSTDFAEIPSILMEYFAKDERVLKVFAKHFQTNQLIPEKMLKKLCISKQLYIASDTQLQVFYAALDQLYHSNHPLIGTTTEILANTQTNYYSLPYIKNSTWQLRFSHLVGYGAKYYSYLVSRALAHLIWQNYFEKDPLNREQGEKYRKECLSYGGGKHPAKLISDYLNLIPKPDILAKSLIDEIDNHQKQVEDVSKYLNN